MGASCSRRSRQTLREYESGGSFTDEDLQGAGIEGDASPMLQRSVQRSLSRLGSRILLAENCGRSPDEGYDIEEKAVGVGGFGIVRLGKKKDTGRWSAIKSVKKKDTEKAIKVLQNEVSINLDLDHPHIAKLYDVYEDDKYAHLAMELCNGGEVLDVITERGKFNEKDAAVLAHQLLQGVTYMHMKSVCHRDLKLENMLLLDKGVPLQENALKLIDFGLSRRFAHETREMTTKAGSALYVAPEVLSKTEPYTEVCDVWSAGVILYIMLSGTPPFAGTNNAEILKKLLKGKLTFPDRKWQHISSSARECVEFLLTRNPDERPSAKKACKNAWIQGEGHASEADLPEHPEEYYENLKQFSKLNSFTKAAMHLVAHRVNQHEVKSLRAAFEKMDTNEDGVLSLEEMLAGCQAAGIADEETMTKVFKRIDTNHSGQVDYTEFLAGAMDHRFFRQQELCQEAFEVFDQDHDGEITVEELREVLEADGAAASKLGRKNLESILRKVDANGDHKIDFAEFVSMLRQDL